MDDGSLEGLKMAQGSLNDIHMKHMSHIYMNMDFVVRYYPVFSSMSGVPVLLAQALAGFESPLVPRAPINI